MVETDVVVKNRAGLHTRPAAHLVKLTTRYSSDIFLIKDGMSINAKSIIGVMTLAAAQGTALRLRIIGKDEQAAAQELQEWFDSGFGEL